jgi:hypothetical protein
VIVSRALPAPAPNAAAMLNANLDGWQMAGSGRFLVVGDNTVESQDGIGLLWFTKEEFADFTLTVDWRAMNVTDNSGVFIRFPALGNNDPANDWRLAVDQGYEIQIDDRGFDPATNTTGDPLHTTGAVYILAPATSLNSRPLGQWNRFEISAIGPQITVKLNGAQVSQLSGTQGRPLKGHIGLQNHHPGSRVQFRNLFIQKLGATAAVGSGN